MNVIEIMHEVRFLNIYILSHIIYYIPPLVIVTVLAIKAVGVRRSDRLSVTHLQCIMVITNIKYEYLYLDFLFQTKKFITSCLKR